MQCGGTSDEKLATEEIQTLIETASIRSEAEKQINKSFASYTAVSYKSQVVAGTNFFVKVDVGNDEFVHLRVFRPLPHTGASPSLAGVQEGKKRDDPIVHF